MPPWKTALLDKVNVDSSDQAKVCAEVSPCFRIWEWRNSAESGKCLFDQTKLNIRGLDRHGKHETHRILTNISHKLVKPKHSSPFKQQTNIPWKIWCLFMTNIENKQTLKHWKFPNGPVWKSMQTIFSHRNMAMVERKDVGSTAIHSFIHSLLAKMHNLI